MKGNREKCDAEPLKGNREAIKSDGEELKGDGKELKGNGDNCVLIYLCIMSDMTCVFYLDLTRIATENEVFPFRVTKRYL